jgi:hypothetical protein
MDEKMLERVRKLLAKAERAGTEHEAEAFTAKANELMLRYSINEAMLQRSGEHTSEKIIAKTITVEGYAKAKLELLRAVARGCGCDAAFYSNSKSSGWSSGRAEVVGWESDVEAFEVLFASVTMQALSEAAREFTRVKRTYPQLRATWEQWSADRNTMEHGIWQASAKADKSRGWCPSCGARQNVWLRATEPTLTCRDCGHTWEPVRDLTYSEKTAIRREWGEANPEPENPGSKPPHGRSFTQSFLIGYARVVGSRLYKQRQRTVADVDESSPGAALAVVDRDKAVDKFAHDRWEYGGARGRSASSSSNSGYYSGRAAGERANLGGSSVGGGRKAIGRGD